MPWQECNLMDERLKFVARLLDGEEMAGLCREFGVSRVNRRWIGTPDRRPKGTPLFSVSND
jgi:hypothetical protein